MEMIYMERRLFRKMQDRFELFVSKVNAICEKNSVRGLDS